MKKFVCLFVCLFVSVAAQATPITLEGMGVVSQWRDNENILTNEIPNDPWGDSDDLFADRVGIYVEFANGTFGSATYSGITSSDWNQCCSNIATPDTTTGFFDNSFLHGLNHSTLPMAWASLVTPFSNNFDLDINTNGFGSNFRANTSGWNFVDIALYSSVAPVNSVPEPTSLVLIGLGLAGLRFSRKKKIT